jgi:Ca2+/Na+ antiporter
MLRTRATFSRPTLYISTEGVFFICEGYTELAPSVAILCTNMAVENKSGSYDSVHLHAQGLQSMLFHSLTLILFCFVLCFEHVKLWLCELSKLFLLYLWRVYDEKHQRNITGFIRKCTTPILV